MRKGVTLIGAVFLSYIGFSLLAAGLNKHGQDGGSHLDLVIGGAVFAVIAVAALAQAAGVLPGPRGRRPSPDYRFTARQGALPLMTRTDEVRE